MKWLVLLTLALVTGCARHPSPAPAPAPVMGESVGDHQGSGFNVTLGNLDQRVAFSCPDASAPIPFLDGGAFVCLQGGGSPGTLGANGPDVVGLFDGGSIVQQITGDAGVIPVLATETVIGSASGLPAIASVGTTVTVYGTPDGGVSMFLRPLTDVWVTSQTTAQILQFDFVGQSTCAAPVTDAIYCQEAMLFKGPADAGVNSNSGTSPGCNLTLFTTTAGSMYPIPTLAVDGGGAGAVYAVVQGVSDAGCIDGGVRWTETTQVLH